MCYSTVQVMCSVSAKENKIQIDTTPYTSASNEKNLLEMMVWKKEVYSIMDKLARTSNSVHKPAVLLWRIP